MKHLLLTTIAAVLLVGCVPKKLQKTKAIPIQQAEPPTVKAPDISIHEAVATDYTEAVKQHLASGTDVNARNDGGYTPLHWVAVRDHKEIAELLIAAGADVNAKILIGKFKGETPLDFAKKTTADLLRKHGGKTGDWFKAGESIHIAASEGHIEAVKQHLEAGVNVNAKNQRGLTPLHAAAVNGHKEIVELSINAGADVNAKDTYGKSALDWVKNEPEIADLLRKHGAKTGAELPSSTLSEAVSRGDLQEVKDFLAKGADANERNRYLDRTILHNAASLGHKEIVELLITKGADVNAVGKYDSKTPLDSAEKLFGFDSPEVKAAKRQIAEVLRKHGGKTGEELKAEQN